MNKNDTAELRAALETIATQADEIARLARNAAASTEPDVSIQSGGTGRPDGPGTGFGGD